MKNNQGMIPIVGTIPYGNSLVTLIPQGFGRNYESRYPNPNAYLSENEDAKYCLHYAKAFFTSSTFPSFSLFSFFSSSSFSFSRTLITLVSSNPLEYLSIIFLSPVIESI